MYTAHVASSSVRRTVGWSKGLTAESDPRVAKMAATRRGQPNWAKGLSAAVDERIARGVAKRKGRRRGPYRTKFDAATFVSPESGTVEIPPNIAAAYAYLLGLYLGDGSIVAKTSRLEITLDARYPDDRELIWQTLARVVSADRAR